MAKASSKAIAVDVTERQLEVLRAAGAHIQAKGYGPSHRQLGGALGLRNHRAIQDHLKALQRLGLVDFEPGESRSLKLTARGEALLKGARA